MKYQSLWQLEDDDKENCLDKDIDVDVLIIGGGITGLSTLYFLKDSNLRVALVEASRCYHGVSLYTTGKITYLQELVYQKLVKKYGFDVAKKYLTSQLEAIDLLVKIINEEKIDCDLEKVNSYVVARNKKDLKKVEKEKETLEKMGVKVFKSKWAIGVMDTYVFQPIKYLKRIKEIGKKSGKEIYEMTRIKEMVKIEDGYICKTDKNTIKAKLVVVACHYPFFLKPYLMPVKVRCEKSYITASKSKNLGYSWISSDGNYSARYHHNYIINLGGSYNIANKLKEKKNFERVIEYTKNRGLIPSYVWKNDDMISVDGMPYIGKIEKNNDSLLMGTAYNTWGMTNGTLAGKLISDMILGKYNKYENLFDPLRVNIWQHSWALMINSLLNIKGFMESKIVGSHKCPHMGCSLVYNSVNNTWDCPCHASRFWKDGNLIKGPSKENMKFK